MDCKSENARVGMCVAARLARHLFMLPLISSTESVIKAAPVSQSTRHSYTVYGGREEDPAEGEREACRLKAHAQCSAEVVFHSSLSRYKTPAIVLL